MPQSPSPIKRRLRSTFDRLLRCYGKQGWWPARTRFEIMIGAVLTQNTSWANVEKALRNLRARQALNAMTIAGLPPDRLAEWITPTGYFNIKARRLQNFCRWYLEHGGYQGLRRRSTGELRAGLLSVNGIGPETADDILLYAFERPVFVVDAYTRRIFKRLGVLDADQSYESIRSIFEAALPPDPGLFNEYHALIVEHGKNRCRPRPRCGECVLRRSCPGVVV